MRSPNAPMNTEHWDDDFELEFWMTRIQSLDFTALGIGSDAFPAAPSPPSAEPEPEHAQLKLPVPPSPPNAQGEGKEKTAEEESTASFGGGAGTWGYRSSYINPKWRNEETGQLALDSSKVCCVALMKALVQEMAGNFHVRLNVFGVNVGELTGDSQMTKQQVSETQVIVTIPKKLDVITRKSTDTRYTNLVQPIIIDEIHLLHEERGPVLESLVARTIRRMEQTNEYIVSGRLSATLHNYQDVAAFLRVYSFKGMFYFDVSYQPCGLHQQFCWRYREEGHQATLAFVHSRKKTAKPANSLRDMVTGKEPIAQFVKPDDAGDLNEEPGAGNVKHGNLRDLHPFGFAIHHAELVLDSIRSRDEAIRWFGYTSYYVRMLSSPSLYDISVDYQEEDGGYVHKRVDIVYSPAMMPEKCRLLKYERSAGRF
ncbi:hypothetical protein ONZ45_g6347 [Pleurotus djamor]|nr:hypothetical protein ONZ45_g6347 [Pleurotus djamor]